MSSTGYPGGKQVETLIDTANAILGSQRSLDADTESGFQVAGTGVQMVNLHSKYDEEQSTEVTGFLKHCWWI